MNAILVLVCVLLAVKWALTIIFAGIVWRQIRRMGG